MIQPGREKTIAPLGLLQVVCGLLLVTLFNQASVALGCGLLLLASGCVSLVLAYVSMRKARR
ncbi:hypothetical protein RND61_09990 [Streptomyces sp. TRM76323]|uniref:Uncharacterized protein n=1 Tax=Streptomyces tamarix TaxID=3078565 RepID=A0ABU3QI05_9ACTN|nr:hypothetical protein [Streptomyces tamarix]MDT9682395.1 hypothetical protein [Streptomyces tamarix]